VQKLKAGAQIRERSFLSLTLAERGNARTELGGCIPADAVLILLDDVGHVNDTSHSSSVHNMHAASSTEERRIFSSSGPGLRCRARVRPSTVRVRLYCGPWPG
jgi:hypothetical protein